jgi:hypothetical protein
MPECFSPLLSISPQSVYATMSCITHLEKLMKRAQQAAKSICEALRGNRPADVLPGQTSEEAWKRLEELVAQAVKDHLEDAYAAGKQDGLREARDKD